MSSYMKKKRIIYGNIKTVDDDIKNKNRIGPDDIEKKDFLDKEIRDEINRSYFDLLKKSTFTKEDQQIIYTFINNYIKKNFYFFTSQKDNEEFVNGIVNDIFGLGIIETLRNDPTVTEIWVNGCSNVFYRQFGITRRSSLRFKSDTSIRSVINKILASVNRKVDEQNPTVDARLLDGSRVAVTLPPVALDGPILNIRKFKGDIFGLDKYVGQSCCTKDMETFLSICVRSRLNILICGGTGSGKTTLLNALTDEIPITSTGKTRKEYDKELDKDKLAFAHIVTIEDSAELQIFQPFVTRFETKKANSEGVGEVSHADCLKHSLRNAVDIIILGEIRDGDVAYGVLQASNTGHEGTMSTIHANDSKGAVERFGQLIGEKGFMNTNDAIKSFLETFDLIISVQRIVFPDDEKEEAVYKIMQITYLAGWGETGAKKLNLTNYQEDKPYYQDLWKYDMINREFVSSGFVPKALLTKAKLRGFSFPPSIFLSNKVKG